MADLLTIDCYSAEQMDMLAPDILEAIGDTRVIVLYGQLGAGKTTLIKALCRQLGVIDLVTSPTFSIVNEYRTILSGTIYHFDFYRINQLREVFDVGYEEYFYSGDYCFIEWPEKVESILPPAVIRIYIEVTSPESRQIIVQEGISQNA
jgi:tRNA threonylcarbamoyladenosine biosynthesis protein TsaE